MLSTLPVLPLKRVSCQVVELLSSRQPAKLLAGVKPANFDQQLGVSIIKSAITKPARMIVENAGTEGSVVVGKLMDEFGSDFNKGYDSAKGEYVDMIAAGIVDPFKVVRTGLG